MMAVVGMAGALGLSALGGGSLVEAVRAAGPYEFSNAAGGTVADSGVAYADPAPVLTVTNTSGVRIRITANGNATETGTCALNQELAPGASCTTQAYACTPPAQPLLVINSTAAPAIGCTFSPALNTYAYNSTNPGAGVLKDERTIEITNSLYGTLPTTQEFEFGQALLSAASAQSKPSSHPDSWQRCKKATDCYVDANDCNPGFPRTGTSAYLGSP